MRPAQGGRPGIGLAPSAESLNAMPIMKPSRPSYRPPVIATLAAALCAVASIAGCKPEPPVPTAQGQSPGPLPSAVQGGNGAAPAQGTAEDSALANRIESALAAETALHGSPIGVAAADGVVTLSGSTRTPDLRNMAAQIALSVEGVKLVRNELAIAVDT